MDYTHFETRIQCGHKKKKKLTKLGIPVVVLFATSTQLFFINLIIKPLYLLFFFFFLKSTFRVNISLVISSILTRFETSMENSRNVESKNHSESETDSESSVNQCLESIRQWIENEKRLYGRTDSAFLMKFLWHSKYDVEKAKHNILRYYANRQKHPKWYNNRDPADEKIQRILDLESFIEMDQTDCDGNIICIIRASGKLIPPLYDIDVLTKVQLMLGDLYFTSNPKYSRTGVVVIGDMRDITASSVAYYTPSYVMNVLECHMAFPIDIIAIHWVNAPAIFNALLSFSKIFMPERLKKCIYTHGNDLKSLHNHVPAKYLPEEYGGTAGTLAVDYTGKMKNKFMHHRKYFLDDEKYGLFDEKETKNGIKSKSGGKVGSSAKSKMLEID